MEKDKTYIEFEIKVPTNIEESKLNTLALQLNKLDNMIFDKYNEKNIDEYNDHIENMIITLTSLIS